MSDPDQLDMQRQYCYRTEDVIVEEVCNLVDPLVSLLMGKKVSDSMFEMIKGLV